MLEKKAVGKYFSADKQLETQYFCRGKKEKVLIRYDNPEILGSSYVNHTRAQKYLNYLNNLMELKFINQNSPQTRFSRKVIKSFF